MDASVRPETYRKVILEGATSENNIYQKDQKSTSRSTELVPGLQLVNLDEEMFDYYFFGPR